MRAELHPGRHIFRMHGNELAQDWIGIRKPLSPHVDVRQAGQSIAGIRIKGQGLLVLLLRVGEMRSPSPAAIRPRGKAPYFWAPGQRPACRLRWLRLACCFQAREPKIARPARGLHPHSQSALVWSRRAEIARRRVGPVFASISPRFRLDSKTSGLAATDLR